MKKLDGYTKTKLIYSGELLLIGIVFLVIGILQLVNIIHPSETFLKIFKWVTIFGSSYILFDLVRSTVDKNRRKKVCLLDKIMMSPVAVYIISMDIMLFCSYEPIVNNPQLFIGPAFLYISIAYIFQSIYHWYHPLLELFDEEDLKEHEEANK